MNKGAHMRVNIEKVVNGFIMRVFEDETVYEPDTYVFGHDDPVDAGFDMLWQLIETLGLRGSRHDSQRLRVIVEAGDKYEPKPDEKIKMDKIYQIEEKNPK
jgi:hypothetical protein